MLDLIASIIVCAIALIAFYVFLKPTNFKNWTIEEIYSSVSKIFKDAPLNFTYEYNEELKQFKNYRINDEGDLEFKWESKPIDTDGNYMDLDPEGGHGKYEHHSDHFTVSGIRQPFECPQGFVWSENDRSCVIEPLCTDADAHGTIKGLTYYFDVNSIMDSNTISPKTKSMKRKYHDRRYAICDVNDSYTLGRCAENKIYNQNETNPPGYDPCVIYDVCVNEPDGFVHFYQISSDSTLQSNQYYMCKNRKSELKACDEGYVYSNLYKVCTPQGECVNKEDDYVIPIDDVSFKMCKGEEPYLINCPFGWYKDEKDNKTKCKSFECSQLGDGKVISKIMQTNMVRYNVEMKHCDNNQLIVTSVEPVELKSTPPIKNNNKNGLIEDDYVVENLIDSLEFPTVFISSKFEITKVDKLSDIPEDMFLMDKYQDCSFNNYTPTIKLNIVDRKVVNTDKEKNIYVRSLTSPNYIETRTLEEFSFTRYAFNSYTAPNYIYDFTADSRIKNVTTIADGTFVLFWILEVSGEYVTKKGVPINVKLNKDGVIEYQRSEDPELIRYIRKDVDQYELSPLRLKGMKPYRQINDPKNNLIFVTNMLFKQRKFSDHLIYLHSAFGDDSGVKFELTDNYSSLPEYYTDELGHFRWPYKTSTITIDTTPFNLMYSNYIRKGIYKNTEPIADDDPDNDIHAVSSIAVRFDDQLYQYLHPRRFIYEEKVVEVYYLYDIPPEFVIEKNRYVKRRYNAISPQITIDVKTGQHAETNETYSRKINALYFNKKNSKDTIDMKSNIFFGYSASKYYNLNKNDVKVIDVYTDGSFILYWIVSVPKKNNTATVYGFPTKYSIIDDKLTYETTEGTKYTRTVDPEKYVKPTDSSGVDMLRLKTMNKYTNLLKTPPADRDVFFIVNCNFSKGEFVKGEKPILFHSAFFDTEFEIQTDLNGHWNSLETL